MVSGDLQSEHFPVILQGVLISNLWALAGAATFHGAVYIRANLVQAYNKENFLRSLRYTGNTIGISVNIH